MSSWMLWAIAITALLGFAAHILEWVLRARAHEARWAWVMGMTGATSLQVWSLLSRGEETPRTSLEQTLTSWWTSMQGHVPPVLLERVDAYVGPLWLAASALLLTGLIGGLWRLALRARSWPRRGVASYEVLVSENFGPALVGVFSPQIVLPRWIVAHEGDAVALVCLHESEHRAARDPWLLAAAAFVAACLPWNAAIWWHLKRLRTAVELDCDKRVIDDGVEPSRYASLLLEISVSNDRLSGAMAALVHSRTVLEKRVTILVNGIRRKGPIVTLAALAGIVLFTVVAVEAPAPPLANAGWSIDAVPVVVIEGDPRVPDPALRNVSNVELLSDGRVVIANGGTSQLLVFDSTGSFLAAWGGLGEGPGQFNRPGRVHRCTGDTLVVKERARVSVLDSNGAFVRAVDLGSLTSSGAFELEGVSHDCSSALIALRHVRPPGGPDERLFRNSTEVYWAPLGEGRPTPVDSFPGNELMTVSVDGSLVGMRFPFAVQPVWATDGERVFYGPADRPEVFVFETRGQPERRIRWSAPPEAISEAEWTRYEEWRQFSVEEDSAGPLIPPRELHPSPDVRPAYSDLLVDDDGNLWVQEYADPFLAHLGQLSPQQWALFDTAGRQLSELTMPPGFVLSTVAHGFAVGIARDAFDVETVQLLRIRKPADG